MTIDKKDFETFKQMLMEEKNKLDKEIKKIATPSEGGGYEVRYEELGSDSDENATEVDKYSSDLALEGSLERQLKDVNDALERVKEGTYGACNKCDKEINIERLRAYPAARTCMDCNK